MCNRDIKEFILPSSHDDKKRRIEIIVKLRNAFFNKEQCIAYITNEMPFERYWINKLSSNGFNNLWYEATKIINEQQIINSQEQLAEWNILANSYRKIINESLHNGKLQIALSALNSYQSLLKINNSLFNELDKLEELEIQINNVVDANKYNDDDNNNDDDDMLYGFDTIKITK